VASQWITNPNNWKFVKHRDGDKENNKIDNLYWSERKHQPYSESLERLNEIDLERYNYDFKSEPFVLLGLLVFLGKGKIRNIYGMCQETYIQKKQKPFEKAMIKSNVYHWCH
jgi:hypothetical protein